MPYVGSRCAISAGHHVTSSTAELSRVPGRVSRRSITRAFLRGSKRRARDEGRHSRHWLCAWRQGNGTRAVRIRQSFASRRQGASRSSTGADGDGTGSRDGAGAVVAEQLGAPVESIDVSVRRHGQVIAGIGGFASRQAILAGSSVLLASLEVRKRHARSASQMLEVAPNRFGSAGRPCRSARDYPRSSVSLRDRAASSAGCPATTCRKVWRRASRHPHFSLGSRGVCLCQHVSRVRSGSRYRHRRVRLLRYVGVLDSGRLINPMIVEGQIHGGIVHGIGNALFEECAMTRTVNRSPRRSPTTCSPPPPKYRTWSYFFMNRRHHQSAGSERCRRNGHHPGDGVHHFRRGKRTRRVQRSNPRGPAVSDSNTRDDRSGACRTSDAIGDRHCRELRWSRPIDHLEYSDRRQGGLADSNVERAECVFHRGNHAGAHRNSARFADPFHSQRIGG